MHDAWALRDAASFPDTAEAGMPAARTDLQHGVRRYMAYGRMMGPTPTFDEMKAHGFEILSGGCLLGGDGYRSWRGYNEVIRTEAARLHVADLAMVL